MYRKIALLLALVFAALWPAPASAEHPNPGAYGPENCWVSSQWGHAYTYDVDYLLSWNYVSGEARAYRIREVGVPNAERIVVQRTTTAWDEVQSFLWTGPVHSSNPQFAIRALDHDGVPWVSSCVTPPAPRPGS